MKNAIESMEIEERAKDTADHCIACTSCVASCPVTAATNKFGGPKLVGPAHSRMQFAEGDVEKSLDFCTNCKNSEITCPSGVAVSTLNMLQRGAYYRTHPHSQRDDMLAHGERMAKLRKSIYEKECACPMANASYANMLLHPPTVARVGLEMVKGD